MIEPLLDHVVLAGPDLGVLVARFAERTGIDARPGGRHVDAGTRNHLVRLGPTSYLELIGPDPQREREALPTIFGIDRLRGPRVVAWMVHPGDIEATVRRALAAGYDPGTIGPLSRKTPEGSVLRWRLTLGAPDDFGGLVPGLIDWMGSPHPAGQDLPDAAIVSLRGRHPDPAGVRRALDALGVTLDVERGEPAGLSLELDTPRGAVTVW